MPGTRVQIGGQILSVDGVAESHHAGMADHVFEFADITRPAVQGKRDLGAMRQCVNLFAILGRESGDEVPFQQGQVFLAFSKGRDIDFGRYGVDGSGGERLSIDRVYQLHKIKRFDRRNVLDSIGRARNRFHSE